MKLKRFESIDFDDIDEEETIYSTFDDEYMKKVTDYLNSIHVYKNRLMDNGEYQLIQIEYKSYYLNGPLLRKRYLTDILFYVIDDEFSPPIDKTSSIRKAIKNYINSFKL